MDSPLPSPAPPQEPRNWVDLPHDITASILWRLGTIEILKTAQLVCSTWRSICKDPSMWRTIDMNNTGYLWDMDYDLEKICRQVVDWSCGALLDITIEFYATDDLLNYIADRSSHLKRLGLVCCYNISDERFSEATAKLPLLEELEITDCTLMSKSIEVVGLNCPLLKSLKLNSDTFKASYIDCNEEALAIAQNFPHLRYLQVLGNTLTNEGLQAILDGCPHLESLDLRQCFNINLDGNLGKRCTKQIKHLHRPYDSTNDYPLDTEFLVGSYEEYYPSGFSDIELLTDDNPAGDSYGFSGSDYSDFGDVYFDY